MNQALPELLKAATSALGTLVILLRREGDEADTTIVSASPEGAHEYIPAKRDVSVPVTYAGRALGRLVAVKPTVRINNHLLEGFASAAGYIIGHAQEIDESGQALAESNLLREVGAMLVMPSELKDSLTQMLRATRQLFNADYATIATVESDGRTLWRAIDGYRTEKYKEVVFNPGKSTASRVIAAGKPLVFEGIGITPEFPVEEFPVHAAEGGVSVLAVPLFKEGKAFGAVMLACRTMRKWKETEIATLTVVANGAALAIEQSRASTSEGAQRAFLGKIIENYPGDIIVFEPPDWCVLLLNSNMASILAAPYRSGASAVGLTIREIAREWNEQTEGVVVQLQRVLETGEPISYEQLRREDTLGRVTYSNWSIVPIEIDGSSEKRVIMLISNDITDTVLARERAKEAAAMARSRAEELDTVINQMADGVSIFDADGNALRINPAGQRLLGRSILKGATPQDYPTLYGFYTLDGEIHPPENLTFRRALRGELVVGEQLLVRRPSGEDVIISVSGSPLTESDGSISGAVLVFHDITHEKMTERLKDEFLSVVSHELRTPLSAIMGYSDLMLRGLHGAMSERQTRALNAVRANADRLLRLINDLLDVSKLESGVSPLDLESVSLVGVVSRTLAQTRVLAVNAGITVQNNIRDEYLPQVLADEPKLQQVIENLLSNALKFTPLGGTVSFSAKAIAQLADNPALAEMDTFPALSPNESPQSLVVTVEDTGSGLEEEHMSRIWDRFYQVDSSAKRRSGGTGLGLAIVRSLVELHGGRTWVKSGGANRGSSFSFSLPVAKNAVAPVPVASAHRSSDEKTSKIGERITVLVVEDDEDQREIICDMLEMEGYQVAVASDGEEALRLASEVSPAAIALDVVLPRRDGWDVLNKLKLDPATRDIPVLIISVVDQQDFGKSLGADEYLVKPLDASHLRTVVRKLLGGGRAPSKQNAT